MRRGVRLAIDVGTVRIGVAWSDPEGILASPYETVARGTGDMTRLSAIIREVEAIEVYVGLPTSLAGRVTASTEDAIGVAQALADLHPGMVRCIDERLTTVTASAQLRASGKPAKRQRQVIDQVAATIMLEHALDSERRTGTQPGTPVPTRD